MIVDIKVRQNLFAFYFPGRGDNKQIMFFPHQFSVHRYSDPECQCPWFTMDDSTYPDESNLPIRNASDDADPTISTSTQAWRLNQVQAVQLCINVATGALGCCANGLVLLQLFASKRLREHPSYFLIKFQIFLDFTACVLLVVSHSLQIVWDGNAEVMRKWGNAICVLFVSNGLMYIVLYAATTNLAIIALERYVKVVHPIKHRNTFRRYAQQKLSNQIRITNLEKKVINIIHINRMYQPIIELLIFSNL